MSAAQSIHDATTELLAARKKIEVLQNLVKQGICDTSDPNGAADSVRRQLEAMDDNLADALVHLGE